MSVDDIVNNNERRKVEPIQVEVILYLMQEGLNVKAMTIIEHYSKKGYNVIPLRKIYNAYVKKYSSMEHG